MYNTNQVVPRTVLNGHSYSAGEVVQHPTTHKLYSVATAFTADLSLTAAAAANAAATAGKIVLLGTVSA